MKITKDLNGTSATLLVEGRIDTTTAPELQAELNEIIKDADEVTLDLSQLVYISSSGLRVLLSAHKSMTKKGGTLYIKNVSEDVMEVFEITGFSGILTIV